jgi:hypothetical protein
MNNVNKFALPQALDEATQQFSRRSNSAFEVPTDFVFLPSRGKFYHPDSPVSGQDRLEVKFMTAREEALINSQELRKAGISFDRVINSILIDKRITSQDLLLGDKNAILLNARKNAIGSEYEFSFLCPKCKKQCDHVSNLDDIKIKDTDKVTDCEFTQEGTFFIKLPVSGIRLELRFLTGKDELSIDTITKNREENKLEPDKQATTFRFMIVSVDGDNDLTTIVSFINAMRFGDAVYLKEKYAEAQPDVSFPFTHSCKECGHIVEGGVPITVSFFWPKL